MRPNDNGFVVVEAEKTETQCILEDFAVTDYLALRGELLLWMLMEKKDPLFADKIAGVMRNFSDEPFGRLQLILLTHILYSHYHLRLPNFEDMKFAQLKKVFSETESLQAAMIAAEVVRDIPIGSSDMYLKNVANASYFALLGDVNRALNPAIPKQASVADLFELIRRGTSDAVSNLHYDAGRLLALLLTGFQDQCHKKNEEVGRYLARQLFPPPKLITTGPDKDSRSQHAP